MSRFGSISLLLLAFVVIGSLHVDAALVKHTFNVGNHTVHKLCETRVITAVNGQLPGPTIHVHEGDTLAVLVLNNSPYNLTIHWHGIFQLLSAWADGPSYVTQCPIPPGSSYTYKFNIIGQEGTLWWHAHTSVLRTTVYGALIIHPRDGASGYPFPMPYKEAHIMLGEWWKTNVVDLENDAFARGQTLNSSDAITMNANPGDLFPCSSNDTLTLEVVHGKRYLLRIINAALNTQLFFKIAGHTLTVVGADASYTTPYTTDVLVLGPGQTIDALMAADATPGLYYIASKAYISAPVSFDNTTATGIIRYMYNYTVQQRPIPLMPDMPAFNDTPTAHRFFTGLTGLQRSNSPTVPLHVDENLFVTFGLGLAPCGPDQPLCQQFSFAASMNNVSFQFPTRMSLLEAHFSGAQGVYTSDFPVVPPVVFDYTNNSVNTDPSKASLQFTKKGTKLKRLKYNATVEVVLQNTAILTIESHPAHLHGFNFFVVGQGFGNYDKASAVSGYNLVNPQERNTISLPPGGWAAIRFKANNPGIWFIHCHLDSHLSAGLATAFEVENGPTPASTLPPPPSDFPRC